MKSNDWTRWLTEPSTVPVYLMLNTLSSPNPTDLLFANDWVEQSFPLYNGTSLAHLIAQSPWLVQLKVKAYAPLGQLLDRKALSDKSWGWAYRSSLGWAYQLKHWQNRQLVLLNNELVVLRLMDSRIATVLIPKMNIHDWHVLMTPVHEVMLDTPNGANLFESQARHESLPYPETQARPFVIGHHLQIAWEDSETFIQLTAENMACELWENVPNDAMKLDTPEGQLHRRLVDWLHIHPSLAGDVTSRTIGQFLNYSQQQGWLTLTMELS
ncbi:MULTISPECIES: DUF4123 domain-containing protein [Providencia]|uniref:DUF4123 domain-containing protein n=1 Tax=Providencia stuartii (strain MRSN 2154) TaxID=1157951 RepID=A0A140NP83_PROSM|nr:MULTISPECIES: DUF4123 domain-containing protein [Providencia]AFH93762.1 hypothetical protein S70_09510 [Providencia stuartii MRSN 2154]APG51186.1 hypothetical protein BGK56_09640 [Providencia stuartii]AVL38874.1 DUF4123 domain-containing protein [Providencia stuartii]MBG5904890.1 DUF4123 domain-containing protein [Providencia stuartii]MBG5913894.1 DUF4123 domain-containing protein [Providencia stuartii]